MAGLFFSMTKWLNQATLYEITGMPASSAGRRVTSPVSAVAAPRCVPTKWNQRVARLLCWLTYQGKNAS